MHSTRCTVSYIGFGFPSFGSSATVFSVPSAAIKKCSAFFWALVLVTSVLIFVSTTSITSLAPALTLSEWLAIHSSVVRCILKNRCFICLHNIVMTNCGRPSHTADTSTRWNDTRPNWLQYFHIQYFLSSLRRVAYTHEYEIYWIDWTRENGQSNNGAVQCVRTLTPRQQCIRDGPVDTIPIADFPTLLAYVKWLH